MIPFCLPSSLSLREPRFTRAELEEVAHGVRAAQLNLWINRGQIPLDSPDPGQGKRRMYSAMDVVAVAIVAQVHDLLGIAAAARVAAICVDWLEQNGRPDWHDFFDIEAPAFRFVKSLTDPRTPPIHSGHAYYQVLGVRSALEGFEQHNIWALLYPTTQPRRQSEQRSQLRKLKEIVHPLGQPRGAKLFVPIGEIINTVLIRLIFREAVETPEILESSGLRAIIEGEDEE